MAKSRIEEQMREPSFLDGETLFYNTEENYCWHGALSNANIIKVSVVGNNIKDENCKVKIIEVLEGSKYEIGKEMIADKNFLLTKENYVLTMNEVI